MMAFSLMTNMIASAMVLNTQSGGKDYLNDSGDNLQYHDANNQTGDDMSKVNTAKKQMTFDSNVGSLASNDIGMIGWAFNAGGALLSALDGTLLLGDKVMALLPHVVHDYTDPRTGITTHNKDFTHDYFGQMLNNIMAWLYILTCFQIITGKLIGLMP